MHKGGIEFRSRTPFPPWTEVTISMESTQGTGILHGNGVVISCTGNKHAGYHVSMVFTSVTRCAQNFLGNFLAN